MWHVITKLVTNRKDDIYLIKMVNFKVVIIFIKILTNSYFAEQCTPCINSSHQVTFTIISFL